MLLFVAPPGFAQIPGPVETYPVNDGVNGSYDGANGEFGPDVGGTVPWTRYTDTTSHPFASLWSSLGSPPNSTFAEFFAEAAVDFDYFDSVVSNLGIAGMSVIPRFANGCVVIDPRLGATPTLPVIGNGTGIGDDSGKWWSGTSGSREILYWPYKVNGAAVMICAAGDGSGTGRPLFAASGSSATRSLLVVNYYFHLGYWKSNKNRFDPDETQNDGYRAEYTSTANAGGPFCEAWFPNDANGSLLLGPQEQAIDAGDLVVFVQENYGMSIPTAMQRTQEAVAFVKQEWVNAIPGVPANFDLTIDDTYLHGTSFGQGMAMVLGLLMPTTFDGSTEWISDDIGMWLGDNWELNTDFDAGLMRGTYTAATNAYFPDIYAFIDQLGCRFDEPRAGVQPWDVSIFSMSHRPGDVKIPLVGHVGDIETQFNGTWPVDTPSLHPTFPSANNPIKLTQYRNRAHGEYAGVIPGVNEFAIYTGTEWSDLKALAANNPISKTRNRLIPTSAPTHDAFPDPYSHTLRPSDAQPLASMPNVLAKIDLRAGMSAPWLDWASNPTADPGEYRNPSSPVSNSNLYDIGQGTWPGYRDQMRATDLDGDGRVEVVFGNLEGYVHVLEFAGSNDTNDPYRLVDEWRSPYLGRGVFACDAVFNNGKATMFFADSLGRIHKITAVGSPTVPYTYNGVIASPEATSPKFLYEGSTPLLLAGNFDGGNSGPELLVLNRYYDWGLFSVSGTRLGNGRLPRHGRALGPSDAFITEIDGDALREVLVGASDGMVWSLDRVVNPVTSTWDWKKPVDRLLPWTGLVIGKAIPCHFNGAAAAMSHILVLGANDDRNDANPSAGTSVIELWTPGSSSAPAHCVSTFDAGDAGYSDETLSFAWIAKPGSQSSVASFAIANGTSIGTFSLVPGGSPGSVIVPIASQSILSQEVAVMENNDFITSMERVLLDDGSGAKVKDALVYATSSGRIHAVASLTLVPLRNSSFEVDTVNPPSLPPSTNGVFNPQWPSNRTLGQTPACASVVPGDGTAMFYFAETANHFRENNTGANTRYRIGSVEIGAGSTNSWNGWVEEARERGDWMNRPQTIRTLVYEDLDPTSTAREFRLFAEVGCALMDGEGHLREFQTASCAPTWMVGALASNGLSWTAKGPWFFDSYQGGFVFERAVRASNATKSDNANEYGFLGGWSPPVDPTKAWFDSGTADNWWYPMVTNNHLTGQIASTLQSVHPLSIGASMKVGKFSPDGDAPPTSQIVTGTSSGYVYCIEPTATVFDKDIGLHASTLTHVSPSLGHYIVGLDTGNLDEDEEDEIVCGSWLDNGTFNDWRTSGNASDKNRGHLYILDVTHGATNKNVMQIVADLQGDDLFGVGNGISSGVFGVKIDDVDASGSMEIWCGDAAGRIYLFGRGSGGSGAWRCVYRSPIEAKYAGFYNNFHPVKGSDGKTEKLLVQSPGYLMLFSVDHEAVNEELSQ